MFEEMKAWYLKVSAADMYQVGFVYRNSVYAVMVDELPDSWLKSDKASSKRGGWAKIRVRLGAAVKRELVESGKAELLGGCELLTIPTYNKGEAFEKLITVRAGQAWVKDSVPFWVAGDIELDGKQVQLKLDGAELTNQRTMERAKKLGIA